MKSIFKKVLWRMKTNKNQMLNTFQKDLKLLALLEFEVCISS